MFQLAICELYNRNIHGYNNQNTYGIDAHILVSTTFTREEFMSNEWISVLDMMRNSYQAYSPNTKHHLLIRNYQCIVDDPSYYKLDIIQLHELPGGECVSVIKTTLLKQLQRRWRKWMNNH